MQLEVNGQNGQEARMAHLDRDDVLVVFRRERRQRVLLRGQEVRVEGPLGAVGDEPNERPDVAVVGGDQVLVVEKPVLLSDDDRRKPVLHQDEVHEESGSPAVAVNERVDVNLESRTSSLKGWSCPSLGHAVLSGHHLPFCLFRTFGFFYLSPRRQMSLLGQVD